RPGAQSFHPDVPVPRGEPPTRNPTRPESQRRGRAALRCPPSAVPTQVCSPRAKCVHRLTHVGTGQTPHLPKASRRCMLGALAHSGTPTDAVDYLLLFDLADSVTCSPPRSADFTCLRKH